MPAAIPIVAAVIGAYASNRAAKSARDTAQMQIDAQKSQATANSGGVMPLADGEAIQNAKKQSILDQIASRGRASTLLSDASDDKLGG